MNRRTELLIEKERNRTKNEFCISSKCEDDLHILFWDFDNIDKYYVERSLSQVQNFHKLNDIYIIKSRHGFNALCLDKLFINEAYNILFYTRWNDFNHIRVGYLSESWALKLSEDKKMIQRLIPCENCDLKVQSNAHYIFFKKYFDFKGFNIYNPDELFEIQLESYKQNKI